MRRLIPYLCIILVFLLAGCGGRNANLIRVSEAQLARLATAEKATKEMAEKTRSTQKRLFETLGELQKKEREEMINEAKAQLMKKHFPDAAATTFEQLSSFLGEWRAVIEREAAKLRMFMALEQVSNAALEARSAEMEKLFLLLTEAQQLIHEFVLDPGVDPTPLINQVLQLRSAP